VHIARKDDGGKKFMQALKKPYNSNPQKLTVYEKSLNFTKDIYIVSDKFHDMIIRELIRKSAAAIPINIAQSRATMYISKEFNYLNVAIENISQCKSLLEMALVRGSITFDEFSKADSVATELLKMAFTLIKRLKNSVTHLKIKKWQVEDFRQFHLYNRSINLMESIYYFIDNPDLNINEVDANKAYRLATDIPLLIATGIGQLNMTERNEKFNEVKDTLKDLRRQMDQFQKLTPYLREFSNDIENLRVQVLKLLNHYFGRLKCSNEIE
jgi:four helix bundle protein